MGSSRAFVVLVLILLAESSVGCGKKGQSPPAQMPMALALHQAGKNEQGPPDKKDADLPRKIIYNAAINLIVHDFGKAADELKKLIPAQNGYVVTSEVSGVPGAPRFGHWQVRVPAERAEAFREAVIKLGELEKTTTDSQDVTEEFYDLDARIRNKKKEEERLLGHLDKSTGKLEDILRVEQELTRVRGEIERQQGRQNLLAKLTAMTTVTITLRERSSYVPPEAASFGATITRTFAASWETLVTFAKTLVLLVVAIAPWLIPVAVVGVPAWIIVRRGVPQRGKNADSLARAGEQSSPSSQN